jgi:site-specific recombinase XerD|tara:strand:- start:1480 stop:2442 length:963 start_codon:yes stop_codon:yes gene_type:complete
MKIKVENPMEDIKKARPTLKPNTVRQYEINLNKLKKIFETDNYDFLSDPDEVMEKIGYLHYTSQRNMLNAVIVLLMALNTDNKYDELLKKYGDKRDEFNSDYIESQKDGVISEKQAPNFTTTEELFKMINRMGDDLKPIKKKDSEKLTIKDKALLQAFILFNIYSRLPFRNDVAGMIAINKRAYNKLSKEDKENDNYLVVDKNNMFFVLNKFKTSAKYEEIKVDIPPDLKKVLRYYLKVNGMGILFTGTNGKAISRNGITQLLTRYSMKYMDGKKISTTILRKVYLSSKYSKIKDEMKADAKMMGNSVSTQQSVYVKNAE